MEKRKKKAVPQTTITRDPDEFGAKTGNLYESVIVMSKRANQISAEMKEDLEQKLMEFSAFTEGADEIQENTEQIELSKFYEKLPKPVLVAAKEFEEEEISYRNPLDDLTTEEVEDDLI